MSHLSRENAEHMISQRGWLLHMPAAFTTYLLQHALLLKYGPGQVIFKVGDPAGGIYGLVTGTVIVSSSPPNSAPRRIHIAVPGGWTGEDGFLTGQSRRIELLAQDEAWVMHVPLENMEKMVLADPLILRAFGTLAVMSSDSLLRMVHDLQQNNASARIASVLHRLCWSPHMPLPVSQENLSIIANTSRKQANSAVQRFVDAGWVVIGYRSIRVLNPSALKQHAEGV